MEKGYLDMELLRFTTAGSVDDGKSTLIGRLLYDSKSIFEDQLEAVETASRNRGNEEINLALLTDGLRAEREQGITIDVAYRYFATPKRKFIIADTPGHVEYTRNMATGASTADLAVILVDARHGVLEQTVRHTYIAALLGIPHIVVCVNKMDLVEFSQEVFRNICTDYREMSAKLPVGKVTFMPISAKLGDNVVEPSQNMPWYDGGTLLNLLETVPVGQHLAEQPLRMPVQHVIRPISEKFHDFRGYAGRLCGGKLSVGDAVTVWPSGKSSTVESIWFADKQLESAFAPESVTVCLNDDIDISRGDLLVRSDEQQPVVSQDVTMMVCWLREEQLQLGKRYTIRQATAETVGMVKEIEYKVDINSLQHVEGVATLEANDIARIRIRTARPLIFDVYTDNRTTGSLVFIDPDTNDTVGAGMIIA